MDFKRPLNILYKSSSEKKTKVFSIRNFNKFVPIALILASEKRTYEAAFVVNQDAKSSRPTTTCQNKPVKQD